MKSNYVPGCVPVRLDARDRIGLISVKCRHDILDLVSSMTLEQTFFNSSNHPLEIEYTFPVDSESVTYSVTAAFDGKRISTRVEEKKKAQEQYDTAVKSHKRAVQVKHKTADISILSLGNLEPRSTCVIQLKQLTLAALHNAQLRFCLPTVVASRYGKTSSHSSVSAQAGRETPQAGHETPQAGRETPQAGHKTTLADSKTVNGNADYKLMVEFHLQMSSAIKNVSFPSHEGKLVWVKDAQDETKGLCLFKSIECAMDRDIVVLVDLTEPFKNRAVLEWSAEHKSNMLMAAFCLPELGPEERVGASTELFFVLDCSGSMDGLAMDMMRNCMLKILKSMDESQTFNCYRFGSGFKLLWRKARPYTEQTLLSAEKWVGELQANMGGTELLPALQHCCPRQPSPQLNLDKFWCSPMERLKIQNK